MSDLLPCPWCGETPAELLLRKGSTYRWAEVSPSCCGDVTGEIRRTSYLDNLGTPEDHASAREWWNTRKGSEIDAIRAENARLRAFVERLTRFNPTCSEEMRNLQDAACAALAAKWDEHE